MAKKNRSIFRRNRSSRPAKSVSYKSSVRNSLRYEPLEGRDLLAVAVFQQGLNTYDQTTDTVLFSQAADSNFGAETAISVDQQDANGVRQGLIKFGDIIGDGSGVGYDQIPAGAIITRAQLNFFITNPSTSQAQMSLYPMLESWDESTATWNNPTSGSGTIGGVQASEGEVAGFPPTYTLFDPRVSTSLAIDDVTTRLPGAPGTFDVTSAVQSWVSGEITNEGFLVESTATDGWDFDTSEGGVAPYLFVDYEVPAGTGTFQFLDSEVVVSEGADGAKTDLVITVARLGGSGAATVDYTITNGTAFDSGPDDDFDDPTVSNTLSFGANDFVQTITIEINDDIDLEGNEEFTVSLSNNVGAGIDLTKDELAVTIADNDALINEVLANVSDPPSGTADANREYVELVGTPNASLADYFFVVFEGQEEEGAAGGGVADVVVDLSSHSFGSDGLLVISNDSWEYGPTPAGTTHIQIPGFSLENDSQTYALVRTDGMVGSAPVQGTDYDTVGSYVGTSRDAVDSPLGEVGLLDVAPFAGANPAAVIVDSVSVFNGGSDRDRAIVQEGLGLPGVHVHQPTRTIDPGDNLASDAVSRRFGDTLPNAIGSWFNGDILASEADDFGVDPIEYQNGTTKISAVAPDGAVLTPGTRNILNNVFITADVADIDEPSSGTVNVTFTVTREGDISSGLTVNYTTLDGTATGGEGGVNSGDDYDAELAGSVNFTGTGSSTPGSQTVQITVAINSDMISEGFETFSVQLTSAAVPYLITEDTATVRINDGDVLIADFQQGVVGTQGGSAYSGTADTFIDAEDTRNATNFGTDNKVLIDDAEGGDFTGGGEGVDIRPQQGLIRFDDLFEAAGAIDNEIPDGARIFGAQLNLFVTSQSDAGATINFHRMLVDWNENTATWNVPTAGITNGITPDAVEAYHIPDFSVPLPAEGGEVEVPMNIETIQAWANGDMDNYGWVAISDSGQLWEFDSSEGFTFAQRPKLTIQYTDPVGEEGVFAFAQQESGSSEGETFVGEGDSTTVVVNRIGGTTTAATVDFRISFNGTATAGDIGTVVPATSVDGSDLVGTLSFAAGQLSQTITIPTVGDSTLELDETFTITLENETVADGILAQADSLEVTIRNDDAATGLLVNEIVYNQPGNDGASEMFEIAGTPGTELGGYYAVVIAGDVGADQGATDLVVDLGSFSIGANGTLLIGAQTGFNWDVPAGTTFVGIPELDNEFLGGNDNGTSTYALVYSPDSPLFEGRFDYDFNNSGGTVDLPAGAVIVDSVAIFDSVLGDPDNEDTSYTQGGGTANAIFQEAGSGDAIDGVSRTAGNTAANSAGAWFGGDLIGSDDALVYDWRDVTESFNLPQDGAAATPGLPNTVVGTAIEPVSATYDSTANTLTVVFTGDVDQVLVGDGTSYNGDFGPAVSITDTNGVPVAGVSPVPVLTSGIGTSTLTFTLAGSLPAGEYNVNIVGNSLVAEGRAVDADLTSTPNEVSLSLTADADFDNDTFVSGLDFLRWQRNAGTSSGATNSDGDADADMDVDGVDLDIWESQYGTTAAPVVAAIEGLVETDALTVGEPVIVAQAFSSKSIPGAGTIPFTGQLLSTEELQSPAAESQTPNSVFPAVDFWLSLPEKFKAEREIFIDTDEFDDQGFTGRKPALDLDFAFGIKGPEGSWSSDAVAEELEEAELDDAFAEWEEFSIV